MALEYKPRATRYRKALEEAAERIQFDLENCPCSLTDQARIDMQTTLDRIRQTLKGDEHLIAASPDLLKALEEAQATIFGMLEVHPDLAEIANVANTQETINLALQKARGGE